MLDSELPTNFHYTTSGATLKARDGLSDFALVELSSDIPEDWRLVWSGWDRSETIPPFVYGLHHPRGSVMKVSVDYDQPAMTPGGLDNGLVWTIFGWEIGGLQPGSSGSPLLDNNGRIRGQAWYIDSNLICQGVNSGSQTSGYGRLNVAWDAKNTPQQRLEECLDPANTGAMTTDFYPPQSTPDTGASIQFYKADNFDCGETITPSIRLINNGLVAITSAQLSYSYSNGTAVTLDWTGILAENQSAIIELPTLNSEAIETTVNVTLISANGSSNGLNQNNDISTTYSRIPTYIADYINLEISTDMFGDETSLELINENGGIIDNRSTFFYGNSEDYNHIINLPPGCYTFVVKDSYGDGICCSGGQGQYTLSTSSGDVIVQGGNFNVREYTRFKISSSLSKHEIAAPEVSIYPNPSSGIFNVILSDTLQQYEYQIYATTGQKIAEGELANLENTIDISGVAKGVYILKVNNGLSEVYNYKIIRTD